MKNVKRFFQGGPRSWDLSHPNRESYHWTIELHVVFDVKQYSRVNQLKDNLNYLC